MNRLVNVLSGSDVEHLRKILNSSLSVTPAGLDTIAKVQRFLKTRTFIADESTTVFRKLPSDERERLLSELLWRITCYLDGSETTVIGVTRYDLGGGFIANQFEKEGKPVFCLAAASP